MSKVLIVEDSPTAIAALEQILRREGHEVSVAMDGLSAFAMLSRFKPEIILLDIGLPMIGGMELCLAIRQTPQFEFIPIIIVTGSHKHINVKMAQQFGANAYLTKPVVEADLIAAMSQCLMVVAA